MPPRSQVGEDIAIATASTTCWRPRSKRLLPPQKRSRDVGANVGLDRSVAVVEPCESCGGAGGELEVPPTVPLQAEVVIPGTVGVNVGCDADISSAKVVAEVQLGDRGPAAANIESESDDDSVIIEAESADLVVLEGEENIGLVRDSWQRRLQDEEERVKRKERRNEERMLAKRARREEKADKKRLKNEAKIAKTAKAAMAATEKAEKAEAEVRRLVNVASKVGRRFTNANSSLANRNSPHDERDKMRQEKSKPRSTMTWAAASGMMASRVRS
eukprot:TRINITY_DN10705_c0_g1_i1.p2 TRINITY_DN10705_c0_g1~~TRINITY_DN10705_c0_g1_i1.p2  ORF type:complete len:273 (-),score=55.58 TRINITY_DN10705_c0_g1_i1:183-1001(-)